MNSLPDRLQSRPGPCTQSVADDSDDVDDSQGIDQGFVDLIACLKLIDLQGVFLSARLFVMSNIDGVI